jgi:hypothetical protein
VIPVSARICAITGTLALVTSGDRLIWLFDFADGYLRPIAYFQYKFFGFLLRLEKSPASFPCLGQPARYNDPPTSPGLIPKGFHVGQDVALFQGFLGRFVFFRPFPLLGFGRLFVTVS